MLIKFVIIIIIIIIIISVSFYKSVVKFCFLNVI